MVCGVRPPILLSLTSHSQFPGLGQREITPPHHTIIDKSVSDEHRRHVIANGRVLHEFVIRDPVPQIISKGIERTKEFPGECSLESLPVRMRIRHRQKGFALPGDQVIADDPGKREPPAGRIARRRMVPENRPCRIRPAMRTIGVEWRRTGSRSRNPAVGTRAGGAVAPDRTSDPGFRPNEFLTILVG